MNKKGIWLGALATLALVGCSTGKPKEEEATPINLMSASELTTLDTSNMLDFPDAITHTAAFEGLYALDENDEVISHFLKLTVNHLFCKHFHFIVNLIYNLCKNKKEALIQASLAVNYPNY